MKADRQSAILEIIASSDIETQNQLMAALEARGVSSTQATLSRDIKELRLVKELSPSGKNRYVSPSTDGRPERRERLHKIFKDSVLSCETAMNLIVVKTIPGLASAAGAVVDSMAAEGFVGTVGGDDTLFVAMKDAYSAEVFCGELKALF